MFYPRRLRVDSKFNRSTITAYYRTILLELKVKFVMPLFADILYYCHWL